MQVQSTGELIKLWREGKVPLLMVAYSWMLGQVGDALGVQPGEEFRVALMEAQKVGDVLQIHLLPTGQTVACILHIRARELASLGVQTSGNSRRNLRRLDLVTACRSAPRWRLQGICHRGGCWHGAGLHCLSGRACGLSAAC